jgi:hypothetical protein
MLNDFLARLALGILAYLERRARSTAQDADADPDSLRLAGDRLREWMRESDRVRAGREPDADRPVE